MASKALNRIQGSFTVAAPNGEYGYDVKSLSTGGVLIEKGKSYSQTFTFKLDDEGTDIENVKIYNFLTIAMGLCTGMYEKGQSDLEADPVQTKKVSRRYTLLKF